MTKKTYIALAKDLGELFWNHHWSGRKTRVSTMITRTIDALCYHLRQDNPRFDSTRFRNVINEVRKEQQNVQNP